MTPDIPEDWEAFLIYVALGLWGVMVAWLVLYLMTRKQSNTGDLDL